MECENEAILEHVKHAVLVEKLKRIKRLVEKGFSEEFVMDVFELTPDEYEPLYQKLFPFGIFSGPFKVFQEQEIKSRMLQKAGYSLEESERIIAENPIFFPPEVEERLNKMFHKEIEERLNREIEERLNELSNRGDEE